MRQKPLLIGIENFKGNYYYVDKTNFIKEFLNKREKINLFTCPRRFGKTLALSMLQCYFELEMDAEGKTLDNRSCFEGMKIMDAEEPILTKWSNIR